MDSIFGGLDVRDISAHRAAFRAPLGEAAVQHRDRVVPDPAQHPPQRRGHRAVGGVVAHDLVAWLDARAAEPSAESVWSGKRMATVLAGFRRREVAIQAREKCPGYVRLTIFLLAELGLGEVVAAVEH